MTMRDCLLITHFNLIAEGSLSRQSADRGHQNTVPSVFLRDTSRYFPRNCQARVENRRIKRILQRVWHHCHAGGDTFVRTHLWMTLTRKR